MKRLIALLSGLVFGAGLILSGMTSPARVIGFLDVAGQWDPSLAFVMGGAVLTALPLFALARRWEKPVAGETFDRSDSAVIDRRLIGGAAIFGIGWGLTGICPGPGLVNLMLAPTPTIAFVIAMIAGLGLARIAVK